MKRPDPNEYNPYYETYIKLVPEGHVLKTLSDQIIYLQTVLSRIPKDREDYCYAQGKWTIKEVIGHLIDTERIMAYRALAIARREKGALPGYDENKYVAEANFNYRTLSDLAQEFSLVRAANISLFKTFNEENLNEIGNANNNSISVRALLFIIAGHPTHHLNVLKTRYLVDIA